MKPFHFLAITLLASAIFTSPTRTQTSTINATPFADVPANHWAAPAVKRLAELGIIEGFPVTPKPVAQKAALRFGTTKTKQNKASKSSRATKTAVAKSQMTQR